jgi:hypothetical protein
MTLSLYFPLIGIVRKKARKDAFEKALRWGLISVLVFFGVVDMIFVLAGIGFLAGIS